MDPGRQTPSERPGVLFDVDGTLVDNSYFHTVAWWRACREGGVTLGQSFIHRLIGQGSDQFLASIGQEGRDELADRHTVHMEPFQSEQQPFARAADLLRELHRRGAVVALASSMKGKDTPQVLELIGAGDAIAAVTTSEDVEATKPAPDLFGVALKTSHLDPARTLVVGDTGWDIEAAARAGVACVALQSGGWAPAELSEAGAIAVYRDAEDLLAHLDESPLGALLRGEAIDGPPA
ncbi:MAG: HAD family hydrolase [Candidatus Dormibacteria bacterium]